MRVVARGTPRYGEYQVYLDGELEEAAFEADDEAGYVVRARRGPDGRLVHPVECERVEGRVELVPPIQVD